jgi:hypothetical protein
MKEIESDISSELAATDLASDVTPYAMTAEASLRLQAMLREKAQWFVVEKSIWVTDRWRAIAGPFADHKQAQVAAHRLIEHDLRDGRQDYHTRITSLSETLRTYQDNVDQLLLDLKAAAQRRRESGVIQPEVEG